VVLGKDVHPVCVTKADFFFADGELTFVTGDEEGVIRMYEYNPSGNSSLHCTGTRLILSYLDPESKLGQHLLLRTEFHGQTEYHTSVAIARRTKDDQSSPQEKLILGRSTPCKIHDL
jgi:cleavage and polyadenylation specificity factor subunit 1